MRQCGPVALALGSRDLVEFDPGSPWFNFPAALVNSQLVYLRPVGILNSCCCYSVPSFRCVSLSLKSPYGERSIKYVFFFCNVKHMVVLKHLDDHNHDHALRMVIGQ